MTDLIDHPPHYTTHPSGIECIQITEHMTFTLGNAIKYIWRADLKGNDLDDLRKAAWYIAREISKREQGQEATQAARTGPNQPGGWYPPTLNGETP